MPGRSDRPLPTRGGSRPRPEHLTALNAQRASGEFTDEAGYQEELRTAVIDLVRRQKETGVDLVNDGEYGHSMGHDYDYGPWWTYIFQRLGGLELVEMALWNVRQVSEPRPGELVLGTFAERRDWNEFLDAYMDPHSGAALPDVGLGEAAPVCRGPITYQGHDALQRDIANVKAGLDAAGIEEGFLNSVAPASCMRFGNEFYETEEELLYACADAMREEYQAI